MNKILLTVLGMTVFFSSCTNRGADENPLLSAYNTPFNVAPFEKIKPGHFTPAFTEAIARHDKEIDSIVNNAAVPTFANTIEALEFSGLLLDEINNIFFNLISSNTNDSLQKISQDVAPLLSQHRDNILLNAKLFQRIKVVYEQRVGLTLNQEQTKLLEETYKRFIRGGAGLNGDQQNELRTINKQLAVLTLRFADNVLAETNSFQLIIDNKNDLAGLPQGIIDAASEAAKDAKLDGKWLFTLHNPSVMPFLQYADNRELRKKIWDAYTMRCNNGNKFDNKIIIDSICNLRLQKAKLLGFKNFAAYSLDDVMAKTPENVYALLMRLWEPAVKVAKQEEAELQAMMDKEGKNQKIEPWDWRYYAEKLRKQKYDLDEEILRPYFELENVKKGVFEVASRLYHLSFIERNDIPKYHPDVVTYEVHDSTGKFLSLLFMDFHPRASKNSGAWMSNYRPQYIRDGKETRPIITVVCNFTKPTQNQPSLLTFEEVSTLFHEFGHALHGMLTRCTYPSLSGTSVARDFVELPSQIMENWAAEPEVMKLFAKHYKTGEVIPAELTNKLNNSKLFNQGFETVEYLAASLLDMDYHVIENSTKIDPLAFEDQSMTKIGLIPQIISRYKSTYFKHIFSTGYEAGYYSYIWAAILDADAFEAFRQHGFFDPATANSFRINVLEKGGTDDPMKLYKQFRGAGPDITPLLKRRGLIKG